MIFFEARQLMQLQGAHVQILHAHWFHSALTPLHLMTDRRKIPCLQLSVYLTVFITGELEQPVIIACSLTIMTTNINANS